MVDTPNSSFLPEPMKPHLIEGKYAFVDVLDIDRLREVFEKFSQVTGLAAGLFPHPGQEPIIATGWPTICTHFHRHDPSSHSRCLDSNRELTRDLKELEDFCLGTCQHGLVVAAIPIMMDGAHVASISVGQVFFSEPDVEVFRRRGEQYGYEMEPYLEALGQVPVVCEAELRDALALLAEIAEMLAEQGLSKLRDLDHIRALRQSEERYRRLFGSSLDFIYTHDLQGRFITVNPALALALGYTPKEMVGRSIWKYMRPVDRDAFVNKYLKAIVEEGVAEGITVFNCKDGRELIFEYRNTLLTLAGQEPCVSGSGRDISNRWRAEKAAERSEAALRTIFNNLHDSIFIHNAEGEILDVNDKMLKMYGVDKEQALRLSIIDDYTAPDQPSERLPELWGRVVAGENSVFEWKARRPSDGHTFWVEVALRRIEIQDEVFIVANVRDMTSQKETEAALRESHERVQAILDASPDPVVSYDREGGTVFINPAFRQTFGWSLEELRGQQIDFVPEGEEGLTTSKMRELFDTGRPVNFETRRLTKDGRVLSVMVIAAPVRDAQGDIIGMVVDLRDITAQKKLEEQLRQSQKMEALGTLAGGIAHDFNNILSTIMGYGERARTVAAKGRDISDELNHIVTAADRAAGLVKQMLTFSRRSEADLKSLDLNQLVSRSVKMLEHIIPKMINLQTKLGKNLDPVWGDSTQLEQVIMNLANNAADAMPDGGTLTFQTAPLLLDHNMSLHYLDIAPGKYILLSVSDTGEGMDRQTLSQIFDPFFTTKEIGKGTGLGLSTVYGIVMEHGGRISCYSEVGLGTTFKIYLPAHSGASESPGADEEAPQEVSGGKERILLVDDEATIRDLGKQILEEMGYKVTKAASGEEALYVYERKGAEIDLVVLDLGMPGMGGLKCLKELKAIDPDLKVLVASGYYVNGKVKEALNADASGFLPKPFRVNDLLSAVRAVLDG